MKKGVHVVIKKRWMYIPHEIIIWGCSDSYLNTKHLHAAQILASDKSRIRCQCLPMLFLFYISVSVFRCVCVFHFLSHVSLFFSSFTKPVFSRMVPTCQPSTAHGFFQGVLPCHCDYLEVQALWFCLRKAPRNNAHFNRCYTKKNWIELISLYSFFCRTKTDTLLLLPGLKTWVSHHSLVTPIPWPISALADLYKHILLDRACLESRPNIFSSSCSPRSSSGKASELYCIEPSRAKYVREKNCHKRTTGGVFWHLCS